MLFDRSDYVETSVLVPKRPEPRTEVSNPYRIYMSCCRSVLGPMCLSAIAATWWTRQNEATRCQQCRNRPRYNTVVSACCRSLYYVKTWRHPQNRKYIAYRRGASSHGYMVHVQKIWWSLYVYGFYRASLC